MIWSLVRRRIRSSIGIMVFCFAAILNRAHFVSAQPMPANEASGKPPAMIIGFVGGFISHDNPVHSEVQLAARLRKEYPAGGDVETYEGYRREKARQSMLKLLDTNHDGT